jgi:transposase
MLKAPDVQRSFCDAEYLCERLIPADSFYRRFREIVAPLIKDEDFDSMYCKTNGRPPISPSLLAMASILQFYRGFSDREMEAACMFDIQIKFALGLKLDERPFDHSSLGDFRERLLKNGKEKEIFDRILDHLVKEGLIKRDEIQRIDTTHIIADVAIPTVVTLVKKGIFNILKPLKKRRLDIWDQVMSVIHREDYTKATINHEMPGRLDLEKRKRKLVEVVADAHKVIAATQELTDPVLRGRVHVLQRILCENTFKDAEGIPRERVGKEKRQDLLVSPVDPDARFGAKSPTKRFTGYKAQVTESVEGHFITNIKAMQGNRPDGETAVETVAEQRGRHGLVPSKVIGDTAYSDGAYRKSLKEKGVEIVAPLRKPNTRTKIILPKHMFKYDEKANTVTCPQGITVGQTYTDWARGVKTFHFPVGKCNACPMQKQCTNCKEGRRSVGIGPAETELRAAEVYNATEQFKQDMRLRPPIEGKLSELKRHHGLTRARFRGIEKVGLQCYFTAAAVNIKRWFKLLAGLSPSPGVCCPAMA